MIGDVEAEPIADVRIERNAKFPAGLRQTEHDVSRLAFVTHGAAGDLPLDDTGTNVVLGRIGV